MNGVCEAPARCQACGHGPSDGDPLVFDGEWWIHESHTADVRSGFYREAVAR